MFQRVGESTDVVRKEMYDFDDKGGRRHRPAPRGHGVASSGPSSQHRPPTPWKAWYAAPQLPLRTRRKPAGSASITSSGSRPSAADDPDLDVEVIALAWQFYAALGLRRRRVCSLNSLGDATCRPAYRQALLEPSSQPPRSALRRAPPRVRRTTRCGSSTARSRSAWRPPPTHRASSTTCATPVAAHFERVHDGLARRSESPTSSTPAWCGASTTTPAPRSSSPGWPSSRPRTRSAAAAATTGWPRQMGGPPTPGIGFGLGTRADPAGLRRRRRDPTVERGARTGCLRRGLRGRRRGPGPHCRARAAGLRADRAFDGRSPKSQLKSADRSGTRLALIVGPDEAAAATVSIKDLRAAGPQETVPRADVVAEVRRRLAIGPPPAPAPSP